MSKQLDSILGRMTTATPRPAPAGDDARAQQATLETAIAPTAKLAKRSRPAAKPATPDIALEPASEPVLKPTSETAEPQRPIQAVVPVSVARALAVRAASEDTTVRTLILQGLQAIGLDVPDAELRDRRR